MIGQYEPERLVFLDETGTHLGFTRLFARAARGERAIGRTARNRGGTLTLIAALSLEGVVADMVIDGNVNGDVFVAFVQQVLVPCLKVGQVVVLDNLASHRRSEVKMLVNEAGCELVFLPSYSPDFNPIEFVFSWLKDRLRSVEARVRGELIGWIGRVVRGVSVGLALAWFLGCGYDV